MFCCNRWCPNKAAVPLCYTPYKHHNRHQTAFDDNDIGADADITHKLTASFTSCKKPSVSGGGRKEGNTFYFTLQTMHQSIFSLQKSTDTLSV